MFEGYEDDLFWEVYFHINFKYSGFCFTRYYINCDQRGATLYIKIPTLHFAIMVAWDEIFKFYQNGGCEYACEILDNTINEAKRRLGFD